MKRPATLGDKIEQLETLLGTADLNAFEQQFVADIARRFKDLPDLDRAKYAGRFLLADQIVVINQLYARHFT